MKKIILVALSIISFNTFAVELNAPNDGARDSSRPAISVEMKAAFESCKALGKPHEAAFDDCMKSKGFEKPAHDKMHPPMTPEMKAAADSCKSLGKPHEEAFDTCMKSKGFEKPKHDDMKPQKQ